MSELHELRPDRPASVVLTAEDVRRYIAAKHANLPCQACGAESFTMCPERDGAAGEARGDNATSGLAADLAVGTIELTGTIDYVRLLASASTITGGTIRLYGKP